MNPQLNGSALCERIILGELIFMDLCLSALGVRFFKHSVDAKVKVNDAYYREVLLTQKLPSVMLEICGKFFIFQQGNVPAHRTHETINLLE